MNHDQFSRDYARLKFENAFLNAFGDEFQNLFSDIMEIVYPGKFIRVRAYGSLGDKKCDGYMLNEGVIFQCYGPRAMDWAKLKAKIISDFEGAKFHWMGDMKKWIFVHNFRNGLHPDAGPLLEKLGKENPDIEISIMGYSELARLVNKMSKLDQEQLLGGPLPTLTTVAEIGNTQIREIVANIKGLSHPVVETDPVAPSFEKLYANGLSKHIVGLIQGGFAGTSRVKKFFDMYPNPSYADEVAETFKNEYILLRNGSTAPDKIFDKLYEFAGGMGGDVEHVSAVFAVLSYFFERCDIFEDAPSAT